MGTVQFDPVDGVPYMFRDTNTPGVLSTTVVIVAKVTSYEDFFALVSLRSTDNNATEIWGDASGTINEELDFGGAIAAFTGSEGGWVCVAFTLENSGGVSLMRTRWRLFGGTSTAGSTDTEGVNNFNRIRIAANDTFATDMEGQFRFAKIGVWNATLTTGQIDAEFSNRTLQLSTNCVFYNDCSSAANVGVDGSPVAQNMTVSGTPTDVAGDDPWVVAGAMVCAMTAGGTVAATLTGSGAMAAAMTATGTVAATLVGSGAMTCAMTGGATMTATAAAAGAMTCAMTGGATLSGTLAGTGAMTAAMTGGAALSGTLTGAGALAAAMTGGATLTATIHNAAASYDYTVHSSGRYFLKNGSPWWENGEWAVQLFTQSISDATDYLDSCVSHGINSILVELITQQAAASGHGPQGGNGEYPFTDNASGGAYVGTIATADLSTPNPGYFEDHALAIVNLAATRGIRVRLMYCPLGFNGPSGNVDFCQDLLNAVNDTTACGVYGAYLATVFATCENVTWVDSSDYGDANGTPPSSTCKTRLLAIRTAMEGGGCLQLFSYDGQSPSLSTDQSTFGVLSHENGCYTYGGGVTFDPPMPPTPSLGSGNGLETYQLARRGWNVTPTATTQDRAGLVTPDALPCYLQETGFLNSLLADYAGTAVEVRRSHWWAILSGCTAGLLWGDEDIWPFTDTVWQAALDTDGRQDMQRLAALMATIQWWTLTPSEQDGTTQLVVGSRGSQTGSPGDYIAAAGGPTLMLAYCPTSGSAQTFDVDLTDMTVTSIRLRWWNPTDGTFTAEASGVSNSETAFSVTTPGSGDWLLVADQSGEMTCAMTAGGTLTATAQALAAGAVAMSATGTLTATLTGTGAMTCAMTATATLTGTPQGAGAMACPITATATFFGRLRDLNDVGPDGTPCYQWERRFRNFVNVYRGFDG